MRHLRLLLVLMSFALPFALHTVTAQTIECDPATINQAIVDVTAILADLDASDPTAALADIGRAEASLSALRAECGDTSSLEPADAALSPETWYVSALSTVNARECPSFRCAVLTQFERGDALSVTASEDGDVVAGDTLWRRIDNNGQPVYVHNSLLSVSVCDCFSGNTLNCINFTRQNEAQACLQQCITQDAGDVHEFDSDGDGLACENLP